MNSKHEIYAGRFLALLVILTLLVLSSACSPSETKIEAEFFFRKASGETLKCSGMTVMLIRTEMAKAHLAKAKVEKERIKKEYAVKLEAAKTKQDTADRLFMAKPNTENRIQANSLGRDYTKLLFESWAVEEGKVAFALGWPTPVFRDKTGADGKVLIRFVGEPSEYWIVATDEAEPRSIYWARELKPDASGRVVLSDKDASGFLRDQPPQSSADSK